jgi:hypothetical protein
MDVSGLARWEKVLILATPVVALLSVGTLFNFLFPIYKDLGRWVLSDLATFPFLVWVPLGGIMGYILYLIHRKRSDLLIIYSKRMFLGLIGWLFLSIIISILTETGDLFHRLESGPLFKAWAVLVFVLLSASPTLFGTFSVFSRRRWATGVTVSMFLALAVTCMIFGQARSSTIIDQDPFLSLLFIWGVIAYVEGVNWSKRYIDRDPTEFPDTDPQKNLTVPLLRRQISYTMVFVGIASILAYLPVISMEIFSMDLPMKTGIYEIRTVFGMGIIGLILLSPLVVLALVRRRMDRKRPGHFEEEDEQELYEGGVGSL